jgi:hypothetical protein
VFDPVFGSNIGRAKKRPYAGRADGRLKHPPCGGLGGLNTARAKRSCEAGLGFATGINSRMGTERVSVAKTKLLNNSLCAVTSPSGAWGVKHSEPNPGAGQRGTSRPVTGGGWLCAVRLEFPLNSIRTGLRIRSTGRIDGSIPTGVTLKFKMAWTAYSQYWPD